eukprot:3441524-Pyramimonas_sp.AAC.1
MTASGTHGASCQAGIASSTSSLPPKKRRITPAQSSAHTSDKAPGVLDNWRAPLRAVGAKVVQEAESPRVASDATREARWGKLAPREVKTFTPYFSSSLH